MSDRHRLRSFLHRLAAVATSALAYLVPTARRFFSSARGWVLLILLAIAALILYHALSDRRTPFTTDAYVQAYVIQVAPRIDGQVVRVLIRENDVVTKGQLLFEIDPRPFEYRLQLLEAKRVDVARQVAQMESELSAAKSDDARFVAEEAYARAVYDQEKAIYKEKATTDRKYLDAMQHYAAAQAARQRGVAQIHKAEQALGARIGEEHALVAEVQAQLAEARLNLGWTRVQAPANGYVTNVHLREGSYVHVGTPVLTCIDRDSWWVVANFRENSLENLRPGQRVGLTFDMYPGRIFPGLMESVGWGVNEGQGLPSGNLPAVEEPKNWIRLAQRFQVRIVPQLPEDYPLRVGATASVTVYTRDGYLLNGLARVWQRIVAIFAYLR